MSWFSEAQSLYLEDVLGVSPASFRVAAPSATPPVLAVLTAPLDDAGRDLLGKILASVGVTDYLHAESEDQVPANAGAVLAFLGEAESRDGRWNFPRLADMLPGAPDVAASKKRTWSLLKEWRG